MKISKDKVVELDFKVYDTDTNELLEETTEELPFYYLHGYNMFIPKVEEILEGKEADFTETITLTPNEGYGEIVPDLVEVLKRDEFKDFDDIYEGMTFVADLEDDTQMDFVVTEINGDDITIDGNHPFAGRNLKIELKVTNVREPKEGEFVFEEHSCCGGHHEESEEHSCCGGHHEESEEHSCCCGKK